jgi:hypothetical protein
MKTDFSVYQANEMHWFEREPWMRNVLLDPVTRIWERVKDIVIPPVFNVLIGWSHGVLDSP